MAEVGVLNLTIHDNSEEAGQGLKNLSDALSAVKMAVAGFSLAGVNRSIKSIVDGVKDNTKVVSELGKLFSALAQFGKVKNFNIPTDQFTELKNAINGMSIGSTGVQMKALREAIAGEWNTENLSAVTTTMGSLQMAAAGWAQSGTAKSIMDVTKAIEKYNGAVSKMPADNPFKFVVSTFQTDLSRMSGGIDKLKQASGDWRSAMGDATKEIAASSKMKGEFIGDNMVAGVDDGMKRSITITTNTAVQLAMAIYNAIANTLGISSPAKEGIKIGEYFVEGVIIGLQTKKGELASAAKEIAEVMGSLKEINKLSKVGENLRSYGDGLRAIGSAVKAHEGSYHSITYLATAMGKLKDSFTGLKIPNFQNLVSLAEALQENYNASTELKKFADGLEALKAAGKEFSMPSFRGLISAMQAISGTNSTPMTMMAQAADAAKTMTSSVTESVKAVQAEDVALTKVEETGQSVTSTMETMNGSMREMSKTSQVMIDFSRFDPAKLPLGALGMRMDETSKQIIQFGAAAKDSFETVQRMASQQSFGQLNIEEEAKASTQQVDELKEHVLELFSQWKEALAAGREVEKEWRTTLNNPEASDTAKLDIMDKYHAAMDTVRNLRNEMLDIDKRASDMAASVGGAYESIAKAVDEHTRAIYGEVQAEGVAYKNRQLMITQMRQLEYYTKNWSQMTDKDRANFKSMHAENEIMTQSIQLIDERMAKQQELNASIEQTNTESIGGGINTRSYDDIESKLELLIEKYYIIKDKLEEGIRTGKIDDEAINSYKLSLRSLEEQINRLQMKQNELTDRSGTVISEDEAIRAAENYMQVTTSVDLLKQKLDELEVKLGRGITLGTMDTSEVITTTNQIEKLREQIAELEGQTESMTSSWASMRSDIGALFAPLKNLAHQFWNIGRRMMIRSIIRTFISGIKEGIENTYYYSKQMKTDFAPAMDQAATSITYLKNSLGAALTPALQALIPLLQTVVGWIVQLANEVNQILALTNGADSWTRWKEYSVEAFDDTTKAAKGTGKAIKDLLADWDELNIIQSDSSGSGGGSTSKSDIDWSERAEQVKTFSGLSKLVSKGIDFLGGIDGTLATIAGFIIGKKIWAKFYENEGFYKKIIDIFKGDKGGTTGTNPNAPDGKGPGGSTENIVKKTVEDAKLAVEKETDKLKTSIEANKTVVKKLDAATDAVNKNNSLLTTGSNVFPNGGMSAVFGKINSTPTINGLPVGTKLSSINAANRALLPESTRPFSAFNIPTFQPEKVTIEAKAIEVPKETVNPFANVAETVAKMSSETMTKLRASGYTGGMKALEPKTEKALDKIAESTIENAAGNIAGKTLGLPSGNASVINAIAEATTKELLGTGTSNNTLTGFLANAVEDITAIANSTVTGGFIGNGITTSVAGLLPETTVISEQVAVATENMAAVTETAETVAHEMGNAASQATAVATDMQIIVADNNAYKDFWQNEFSENGEFRGAFLELENGEIQYLSPEQLAAIDKYGLHTGRIFGRVDEPVTNMSKGEQMWWNLNKYDLAGLASKGIMAYMAASVLTGLYEEDQAYAQHYGEAYTGKSTAEKRQIRRGSSPETASEDLENLKNQIKGYLPYWVVDAASSVLDAANETGVFAGELAKPVVDIGEKVLQVVDDVGGAVLGWIPGALYATTDQEKSNEIFEEWHQNPIIHFLDEAFDAAESAAEDVAEGVSEFVKRILPSNWPAGGGGGANLVYDMEQITNPMRSPLGGSIFRINTNGTTPAYYGGVSGFNGAGEGDVSGDVQKGMQDTNETIRNGNDETNRLLRLILAKNFQLNLNPTSSWGFFGQRSDQMAQEVTG